MLEKKTNPLKQEKIKKRQELLERGENPYPHSWPKKRSSSLRLAESFSHLEPGQSAAKTFHIAGRLMRKRDMGKSAFFNVRDEAGEWQCYIRKDDFSAPKPKAPPSSWELWELCDIGDIIGLSGNIFKTKKGELSLRVKRLKILCKALGALPEKYHGLEDKELKYRYRHLDLIMDQKSRETFKARSKIIRALREFMNKEGFMEVETPVLQPLYGGALAEPFETYFRRLGQKMYLKISPEIYLKKLIVGGFEKVFEMGKNFRNEGIDRSHSPEFTMMEYYEAYTDYKDQMIRFEDLIAEAALEIKGPLIKRRLMEKGLIKKRAKAQAARPQKSAGQKISSSERNIIKENLKFEYQGRELDLSPPWAKISLEEFERLICSVMGESSGAERESLALEGGLKLKYNGKLLSRSAFWQEIERDIQALKEKREGKGMDFSLFWKSAQNANAPAHKNEEPLSAIKKLLAYAEPLDPKADWRPFKEDLQTLAPPSAERLESLKAELSLKACELTAEKFLWNPIFIMDFPLAGSPLTKKSRRNPRLVERFEPYIAGMEIGNAYTELNDPVDQRQRLEDQRGLARAEARPAPSKGPAFSESAKGACLRGAAANQSRLLAGQEGQNRPDSRSEHPVDESFLQAIETGMPPTGGAGLGVERLVMILTDKRNIKDSMLFPMLKEK